MASSRKAVSRTLVRIVAGLALGLGCTGEPVVPHAEVPVPPGGPLPSDRAPATSAPAPVFLTPAPDAPTVANPVVSFWAIRGQDHTVRMYYHARAGAPDSTTFAELRVRRTSLAAYPDGRPFATGDSVRITVSLVDAERLIVELQPSGLRFSADQPARLKLSFEHTDAAAASPQIEQTLRIWRRESANLPWTSLVSDVETGLHEVKAELSGFSGYAIAY